MVKLRRKHEDEGRVQRVDAKWCKRGHIAADLVWIVDRGTALSHEKMIEFMAFVDADTALCSAQARDEAGEKKALDVQCNIEGIVLQLFAQRAQHAEGFMQPVAGDSFVETIAVPDKKPVNIRIILQQLTGGRTCEPGDMTGWIVKLQVMGYGCCMKYVANRAQAYDKETGMLKIHKSAVFLKGFTL